MSTFGSRRRVDQVKRPRAVRLGRGSVVYMSAVARRTILALVGSLTLGLVSIAGAPARAATVQVPATFTFSGAGWGHGVGMSQYGARGMALDGYTAEQIVTHYYTGTTVTPVPDLGEIAVNLLHHASRVTLRTQTLAPGGGGLVVTVRNLPPVTGVAGDIFTFTASNKVVSVSKTSGGVTTAVGTGSWATVNWSGTRVPLTAGSVPTLLNVTTSSSQFSNSGHRYRYGSVKIQPTTASPNTLEAVNYVQVHDEYLLGIAEVSSSWPAEAMQAQILASRSYALNHLTSFRAACLCNVDDGGGPYYDQTFAGWIKESDAWGKYWRAAVAATITTSTTGQAILSYGKPIAAFYFSASGGATQDTRDVWGGALAYTKSVDDHWSLDPSVPWSKWIPRVRTQAQVAAAFGLTDVVRIDLTSRCASGAVKAATAWSSSGKSATVTGAHLAGQLSLPSRWIWRAVDTAADDPVAATISSAKKSTSPSVVLAPLSSATSVALASNLAAQRGWPLLLTASTTLTWATRAELVRRNAQTVFAVGTVAEIPAGVLAAADAAAGNVVRITGANAADLSVRVASRLGRPVGTAVVVAPATNPALISVASAAAASTNRILLVAPGGETTSESSSTYLAVQKPSSIFVVGSTTDIADSVFAGVAPLKRAAGGTVTDVSATVASFLGVGVTTQRISMSSPARLTMSLVSNPTTPILLVSGSLSASTQSVLQKGVSSITVSPDLNAAVVTNARRA